MRCFVSVVRLFLLLHVLALISFAQQDKLVGRWEGSIAAPQGERPTYLVFKKDGETLTGAMQGMRPGSENQLKDIKVEGNKVTAKAEVEGPQGSLTINYTFNLDGDALNGQAAVDFGGQSMSFDVKLKRNANTSGTAMPPQAAPPTNQTAEAANQQRTRNNVPQPRQKQSIDYFVGTWSYKYLGRESALGVAPRDCTVTFTKHPDGKSIEGVTACQGDGAASKSKLVLVYDEATKTLNFTDTLSSGLTVSGKGDWSSPIAIRFAVDPIKAKGQSLQLRRNYSIVSDHSFTVVEELSEDGGPFVRLGSAVFAKATAQ